MVHRVKPRKIAPLSPMKTDAGGQLSHIRGANAAARKAHKTTLEGSVLPSSRTSPRMARPAHTHIVWVAAKPSKPSMKLNALIVHAPKTERISSNTNEYA